MWLESEQLFLGLEYASYNKNKQEKVKYFLDAL